MQQTLALLDHDPDTYILIAGDILDNGQNGQSTCALCVPCFGKDGRFTSQPDRDELGMFCRAIEEKANTILIHGNHDELNGGGYDPLMDYIQNKYEHHLRVTGFFRRNSPFWEPKSISMFYQFRLSDSIDILCCGKMADSHVLPHLLASLDQATSSKKQVLIVQHYHFHTDDGDDGNMPVAQQLLLLRSLQPYKNRILAILTGHEHLSRKKYIKLFQDKLMILDEPDPDAILNLTCGGYDQFFTLDINGSMAISLTELAPEERITNGTLDENELLQGGIPPP
jgi:3',5'-cyclic AMP phosphodiesterase CpdA